MLQVQFVQQCDISRNLLKILLSFSLGKLHVAPDKINFLLGVLSVELN